MAAINPTDWQARVLGVPERYNLALLGGRGGGKTTGASLLVLRHVVQHAELARVLVTRVTYKSLSNFWDELVSLFETAFPTGLTSNRAEMTIRCPNGAVVVLSNLATRKDVTKLQGQNLTMIVADEITGYATLRYLTMLLANLRAPAGVPLRLVILGNPGGPSHSQVARLHVNGRRPWAPYALDDGSEWVLCPSTYLDNPTIDQERYARSIIASAGGDRALSAAWLEGSWTDLAGAFFAGVWGDHLIIPNDLKWRVPKGPVGGEHGHGWRSAISLDWGQSAPAVALLAVQPIRPGLVGPAGRVYPKGSWIVVSEVHTATAADLTVGKGWGPQMLTEEILAAADSRGVRHHGFADDARGLEGSTLIEQLRTYGLHMTRPRKDRISGWIKLKQMMGASIEPVDPDTPGLWIAENCRYTLETLPVLPRDDTRIEDVDTTANDHGADALRYLVNSVLPYVGGGRVVGLY